MGILINLKFKTETDFQAETRIIYLGFSGVKDARLGWYLIPDKQNRI
jgi:hypothetical protein